MKLNIKQLVTIILILSFTTNFAQDNTNEFGLKAGLNYGKYTPSKNSIDYKFKVGFYAGGFYNILLNEKLRFQPELLFAVQGSTVNVNGIELTDNGGNPLPNTQPYDYEYQIHELTLAVPIMSQYYFSDKFYLEGGPQFGFIIDRSLSSKQQLIDGQEATFIVDDGDTFDFGLNLGFGFVVSEKVALNLRTYSGLIKRDDDIKSLVLNFGLEYRL
jgi:hypothetical protein